MRASVEVGRRGRRLLAAAVVGAAWCAIGSPALATGGERTLWAGVGADDALRLAVQGRFDLDLDDFWAAGLILEQRQGWPLRQGRTAALAAGRLVIDALTWVPAVTLAAGAELEWPAARPRGVVRVEGSLAWRPARGWAAIARLGVQRTLASQSDNTVLLTVGLGWIRGGAASLDY